MRAWCFTVNNPTDVDRGILTAANARYIIWGEETGESGTPHLQGYLELNKPQRLSGMKKLHATAHWEQRQGTRDEARAYCMKDGVYEEYGDWQAGGQGTRNDLEGLMQMIRENKPTLEIMEAAPACVSKHMRFVDRYTHLVEKETTHAFRKVDVQVLWGAAGTGKTRRVYELDPKVFTVNSDEAFPFDGYDGEEAILLDDFYGGFKYHHLLRILDGHQYRANVKGGSRYARWTRVYITSNKQPSEWYQKGLTDALRRRLSSVTEYRNEEAGNTSDGAIGPASVTENIDVDEGVEVLSLEELKDLFWGLDSLDDEDERIKIDAQTVEVWGVAPHAVANATAATAVAVACKPCQLPEVVSPVGETKTVMSGLADGVCRAMVGIDKETGFPIIAEAKGRERPVIMDLVRKRLRK